MRDAADFQATAERMARIAAGSETEFRAVWDEHHARVFRIAAGITLDRDEARDVAQDVFIRLRRAAATWEPRGSIESWLYRSAVNRSLSFRRRVRRGARAAAALLLTAGRVDPGSEPRFARAQAGATMRAAIAELPAASRAVVTLSLDTGLTPAEIAEVLDIEPNAARVRLHRAIEALRRTFESKGLDATAFDRAEGEE